MSIRFDMGEYELPDVVRFVSSALLETLLSLHVLADPTHHAVLHPWVRAARGLPGDLRADLAGLRFAWAYSYPCAAFPGPHASGASFEEELQQLRGLDPELVAFEFGGALAGDMPSLEPEDFGSLEVVAAMAARANMMDEVQRDAALQLVRDPEAFLARLCDAVHRYWQAGFREEWLRVEPLIEQAMREGARRIADAGLAGFVADFPGCIETREDGSVRVVSGPGIDVEVSPDRPLVLCPSIYVWPHVGTNRHAPFSCGLLYPAPAARDEARPIRAPDDLLKVVAALSNETRLRILRMLAARARTTQELAPLIPISEAGLSRHLRQLQEAGLVMTERQGYWVLYDVVFDRLHDLPRDLDAFIRPSR